MVNYADKIMFFQDRKNKNTVSYYTHVYIISFHLKILVKKKKKTFNHSKDSKFSLCIYYLFWS